MSIVSIFGFRIWDLEELRNIFRYCSCGFDPEHDRMCMSALSCRENEISISLPTPV